jgi:hypothetical protein
MRIEGDEHLLKTPAVEALPAELKWARLHAPLSENSAKSSRIDVPTASSHTTKSGRIPGDRLTRRRVREQREGGHLVVGKGHLGMDQNCESVAVADLVILLVTEHLEDDAAVFQAVPPQSRVGPSHDLGHPMEDVAYGCLILGGSAKDLPPEACHGD